MLEILALLLFLFYKIDILNKRRASRKKYDNKFSFLNLTGTMSSFQEYVLAIFRRMTRSGSFVNEDKNWVFSIDPM